MYKRLIYIILGVALMLKASAQVNYRTAELQRLSRLLAVDEATLKDGYNYLTVNGQQVIVTVKGNTVNHIGLRLFGESTRNLDNTPVFDFLERYFLQLKYPPTVKTAQKMISDDQFQFVKGSLKTVDDIRPTDGFGFNYDKRQYTASWNRDGQPLLTVSFPVEYELISGENKIEAENNLLVDIKRTEVKDVTCKTAHDPHYINENFSNRLYYQKGELVSSVRHPAESASNILLSLKAKGQYDLKVTQVSYGFKKTVFNVPLRQWIAFCQNSGCVLYVGIEDISEKGEVSAVVLAVNEAENYNHVLTVTIPQETIHDKKGSLNARLYPYVPTHNVKSLFAEFRKSNPKTFVAK